MDIRKWIAIAFMVMTFALAGCNDDDDDDNTSQNNNTTDNTDTEKDRTPNFITLVLDDMGFSDLGVFGGEIPTPNIDQLVDDGIMLTNFYAAPASTPCRGMLFTGKDHHAAGVGMMTSATAQMDKMTHTNLEELPEYQSLLSLDALPFPELLQENGYHTMHTGKWDLGTDVEHEPMNRGFTETRAAILTGGLNHYSLEDGTILDGPFTNNGVIIEKFPRQYYSTVYHTDMAIDMLNERDKDKPFYLSLCYSAPHNPLQAPAEVTAKYIDTYSRGWDVIREERFKRQKELGLWPADAELPPMPDDAEAWDDLSEEDQKASAKSMAVYAAMIDVLDENIGRLVAHLKDIGEYENTVIILFGDNGSGAEFWGKPADYIDTSYENMGNWNSLVTFRKEWAHAQNTPLHGNKGTIGDGGWHTSGIFHYPKSKARGVRSDRIVSVMDIAPTILDMAKIEYPDTYNGKANAPMLGISMSDMFEEGNVAYDPERVLALELHASSAVRSGDWKLVIEYDFQTYDCEPSVRLYNLGTDPFEVEDLADEEPAKVEELQAIYTQYAENNDVVVPPACE